MKRPNLVYVFADQLRWASVGYNGDELAHTPEIDALAAECADVTNAVSPLARSARPRAPRC